MKYRYQRPHHLLKEYIRTVLILEGFSKPSPTKLPLVTDGMPVFVCRSKKDSSSSTNQSQLTLFGKSAMRDCWAVDDAITVVAYFFTPFSMATLFNVEATTLASAPIDLANWNAHKTNALKTQLAYADSTSSAVEVLDNFLVQQFQQNKKECELIRHSTDSMLMNAGAEMLSEVMNQMDVNQRTFQRMFKKFVGVSPNKYRRICQFQLSFAQLRTKDFTKLTDIAYENGFADQSHFIRSFKEFTQITPNDYLKSGLKKE